MQNKCMIKIAQRYQYYIFALLLTAFLIVVTLIVSKPHNAHSQSTNAAITGYAWSDTIGWIDLNCTNSNLCGSNPFGLSINASGIISGYAWSDTIGWISANSSDISGCPSAPCTAAITGTNITGWLKALSADGNGWDGWISLNGSNYGITETAGTFAGYGWGSDVVGWTDFRYARTTYGTCAGTAGTTYTCSGQTIVQTDTDTNCNVTTTNVTTCIAPSFCAKGSRVCLYPQPIVVSPLKLSPRLILKSKTVQISWDIQNVQSCSVTGTNKDGTSQSTNTVSPGPWNTPSSGVTNKTSSPITELTTYKLSCVVDDPGAPAFTESVTLNIVPTYQEN